MEEERKADKFLENIIHKFLNNVLLVTLDFYEIPNTKQTLGLGKDLKIKICIISMVTLVIW